MGVDLLSVQPHKVSRDLSGYITYIYGAPKTGKTTLATQMPRPILLAAEKGYRTLPGVMPQDIKSWSEMRQAYHQLKQPAVREKYDTIVIDTVDVLADMCTKYICNNNDIDSLAELPYGKGWILFKEEFNEVFRGLTQLDYAIVWLGHEKEVTIGEEPNQSIYIRPNLTSSIRTLIEGMADITGYAHQKKGSPMSVLTLRSRDDSVSCGSRFKYLPDEIEMSYANLAAALTEAIDKEAQEHDNKYVTNEKALATGPDREIDFDALYNEIQDLLGKLLEQNQSNAPKMTYIIEKYLGKGKKVTECTRNQIEQMELIAMEFREMLNK